MMETFRYIPGVATLELDQGRCSGCAMCSRVCPHGVFRLEAGRAQIVDRDACMECGACSLNCPEGAVRVTPGVGCASLIVSRWLRRVGIRTKGCC